MLNGSAVMPSSLELGWPSYQQSRVERWTGGEQIVQQDYIAEEVPVSLVYNGQPHVVMLATPTNLEDFALGFSITEGIIKDRSELLGSRVVTRSNGIEVRLKIPEQRFQCLSDKGRNLTGRTGCGLCGASTLQQAIRSPELVKGELTVTAAELLNALDKIKLHQRLNQLTGAVHAAAWVVPGSGIQSIREDVGRHNALDKLIGSLLLNAENLAAGFVIVTSRASYEMVQKTASVGIVMLAAISAPTGLAIRLAEEAGLTLVGFARDDQHVVYAHSRRLIHPPYPSLIKNESP
ncbi:MAG: formate dehydrogenase accessory sulfurtransferase FdhD [Methylicorpusculum sp.]|uniref:formate dehydrogenase accessory sulfurtransferase FdhD n=1 Tax=Methylicorpusculum sp. TaxID=2713644 RepID=UPI002720BB7A|nr:formate dehydrogenase accessory sulfurtransferase FdhD [Methylicorpusculum sp.]MDO8940496.1 formate dehydrogenase accessory sulfurtransferase FdhD [Methylicorpusculum sp.]MDO9238811.1 formate dehydrogenase accessory sulfurtransferase FdhD [Methylicorpusculum sp.]MDP2179692.1 formate dehydrogenase accessory sulfurtransferase FdhD [Methylicorpusculum sp.]MDP2204502.1 formate dehydrogenase accessory sulfurtransferase FdhD [Methylicorpusculum sp.]MDP3530913.1 formate dehydrogenase accessory sul